MSSTSVPKRNSFLGSLKKSLSRKSSNVSTNSDDGSKSDKKNQNPFLDPPGAQSGSHPSAPPSYNEAVQVPGLSSSVASSSTFVSPRVAPAWTESDPTEDPYSYLKNFDTVFLIDDSKSMETDARWTETRQVLEVIAPICTKRDADGIDIYFLNHRNKQHSAGGYTNIKSANEVTKLFERVYPCGNTLTGMRVGNILKPYLARLMAAADIKPLNLIVITDGFPQDALEETLIDVAITLDKVGAPSNQLGVQLFQVGSDPRATSYLNRLDNDIKKACGSKQQGFVRDIVDTVTWREAATVFGGKRTLTAEGILKVVLGGVQRRLDEQKLIDGHET